MNTVGRVGIGYDIHRLVPGRRLVLGGVEVPSPEGLAGHSDADVLLHAVSDALLGAAGAPDLGELFPPGDPAWAGISSVLLLERVGQEVATRGFAIVHIDATVVAETPKLRPHKAAMVAVIARALGLEIGQVNVKAKTNEGLDAVGERSAIAAWAVALVAERPRR